MEPNVSIIIPVYNTQECLRECLDSAIGQTLAEIEIICVNDGSTDGSAAILEEYAQRDPRVVVLTKPNGGQSSARNAGMDVARGKYLAFLDSDDWIDKDLCKKAWTQAESTDADITMFFCECVGFPDRTNVPFSHFMPGDQVELLDKIRTLAENWTTVWSCLWKRALVERRGLRFHEGIIFEEMPFAYVAAALANKVTVLFDRLYYYRYRAVSTMHDGNGRNQCRLLETYCHTREDLEALGVFEHCKALFWPRIFETLYATYYQLRSPRLRNDLLVEIDRRFRPEDWRTAQDANVVASPAKRRFFRILHEGGQPPERQPMLQRLLGMLPDRFKRAGKACLRCLTAGVGGSGAR